MDGDSLFICLIGIGIGRNEWPGEEWRDEMGGFCFWFVCVSCMTREGAERRRREGWVRTREREERSREGHCDKELRFRPCQSLATFVLNIRLPR
jgi:hypothetical protein